MKITNKNSALVIIDIVNSCCSSKGETPEFNISFKKIRKMVPKLITFIEEYKKQGGRVIYVKITPWNKKHLAKNLVELYKDPQCIYYSDDTTGFDEAFYKVKPEKNDYIITKNTYDTFANPEFDKLLKKLGVQYLIMTGVFGEGCVESTIQCGFSKGYNFVMLKDMIETMDRPDRQALQQALKDVIWPTNFGKTITSKEFLKLLAP